MPTHGLQKADFPGNSPRVSSLNNFEGCLGALLVPGEVLHGVNTAVCPGAAEGGVVLWNLLKGEGHCVVKRISPYK